MVSPLSNWAIGNRMMRWLGEKTLGIAQGRKLPRVVAQPYLRRAARRRLTRPTRRGENKVAFFVDLYANYHDPQLAEALVAVLEHNGVEVYVPPRQQPAGMPSIAAGALDHARRLARRNTMALAEAVRQGYHIVATEPAAALCLKREYPQLLTDHGRAAADDDARLVAENSSEACDYLWRMHRQGRLRLDFKPLNLTLGYHMPCHLAALEVGCPGRNLLGLIPSIQVQHIEEGCSGMAGTFGLQRRNYRRSLRAGWSLISRLRDPGIQLGTTECSTCKMQMEQGTTKPTIHPVKLLALAYDLMPEVQFLLTTPGEELVVT
jgi:Fe-S oxidoreductase